MKSNYFNNCSGYNHVKTDATVSVWLPEIIYKIPNPSSFVPGTKLINLVLFETYLIYSIMIEFKWSVTYGSQA